MKPKIDGNFPSNYGLKTKPLRRSHQLTPFPSVHSNTNMIHMKNLVHRVFIWRLARMYNLAKQQQWVKMPGHKTHHQSCLGYKPYIIWNHMIAFEWVKHPSSCIKQYISMLLHLQLHPLLASADISWPTQSGLLPVNQVVVSSVQNLWYIIGWILIAACYNPSITSQGQRFRD